jgi:hypothetical protein
VADGKTLGELWKTSGRKRCSANLKEFILSRHRFMMQKPPCSSHLGFIRMLR